MKVTVFGATGFVGGHLCERLVERGGSVVAFARNPKVRDELRRKGMSVVIGDLLDERAVLEACSGADVVINTAGALGKWGTDSDEMERVNSQAPGIIVRLASISGATRVIHTSTAGVSGPLPDGGCVSEDYQSQPKTDYQRTKLDGEISALAAHRETGIPLTIIRPSFVYGPGDMHKLSLFRAVASGRMVFVNRGQSRLHPIHVDDLVAGIITSIEKAPGQGETYIIGGSRPVAVKELIETIAEVLGVTPPRLSLPEGLLMLLARIAESVFGALGKEPPITQSRVKLFSENYAYTIQKAQQELGYKPGVELPDGIAGTVEWYKGRGLI